MWAQVISPVQQKINAIEISNSYGGVNLYSKKTTIDYRFFFGTKKSYTITVDGNSAALTRALEDIMKDVQRGDTPSVFVEEHFKSELVAATSDLTYTESVFYDDESSVSDIKCTDENKKLFYPIAYRGNYQSNNIFHDDVKMCRFAVDFPNIGSRRTLEYKKTYEDCKYLNKVYFNNDYPIEELEINFEIPNNIEVELKQINFDKITLEKSEKPGKDKKNPSTIYTFKTKKVKQFKEEKNAPSFATIYPHIIVLLKSASLKGITVKSFHNQQDLYNWCNGLCKQVENDTAKLKGIVADLIKDKNTDEEKLASVFYWVQDRIRYIAFEDGIMGYKPQSADKVYGQLYGDCKGMANLTKTMLKLAGFDARLTWIGTRGIGYNEFIPMLGMYNHMICTVILKDKKYFIDGTEDYISLGDYAHRIQGRTVMVEDGDKFIVEKIPEYDYNHNLLSSDVDLKLDGDKIIGTKVSVFNGEEKTNLLRSYASIKNENKDNALRQYLKSSNKNVNITDIKSSDLTNRDATLSLNYGFTVDNHVYTNNNDKYVFVDYEKEFENFIFDTARVFDYEFDNKFYTKDRYSFNIPSGSKVKSMPSNLNVKTESFEINIEYAQEANAVVYKKSFIINEGFIAKKDMKKWNEAIEKLRVIYNSPIILTK